MSLRISQLPQFQLTLTPALRLSLEILQMPLHQLEAYLSQQVEENPVLEMTQDPPDNHTIEPTATNGTSTPIQVETPSNGADDGFRELWRQADSPRGRSADDDDDLPQRETPQRPPNLYEHLLLQLRCLPADEAAKQIAEKVLGWLDPDGYLRTPLEEIASAEGRRVEELEAPLQLIHRLDPLGVGARTLQECLLIQLLQMQPTNAVATRIVRDHFELFAKRKLRPLAARLEASASDVQQACRAIAGLNPKPARNFQLDGEPVQYYIPDLIVREANGEYHVELNDEKLPRIGLSSHYRNLLRNPGTDPETKLFIREKMRQAVWLLKAVNQRHSTLLALARSLVQMEKDYFSHGVTHLKSLTQESLARSIGCHASTISRAISGKSIQTPYGVMPLDAFFGGGVSRPEENGAMVSSRTIQAQIKRLVDNEDPAKPLSDHAIENALKAQGYPVARRTVAKYRTAMKVLPAHLRKKCF